MSTTIKDQFPIQFTQSFMDAYQQKGSRLSGLAGVVKPGKGEFVRFNKYNALADGNEITEWDGDTVYDTESFDNRILFPKAFSKALKVPYFESAALEDIVLPNSQRVMQMANALGRAEDSYIISTLTGSAYEGTTSPSAVAYDSDQAIAVNFGGSNSGLTFNKISQARYMFEKAEVDDGTWYMLVTAKQLQDLHNDIITNHADDYASVDAARSGAFKDGFLGFKFVRTELLPFITGDIRGCIAFSSMALGKATWNDHQTFMERLALKNQALSIQTMFRAGYARIWDEGVITIACDESP